jgi:Fe-S-cluster-containing hydrogenase component 2
LLLEKYKATGFLSCEELIGLPGVPNLTELKEHKGPLACIECAECIPCNPCETACPHGAIEVGNDITGLPKLLVAKCTGCGLCIPACPGLAIFVIDYNYSECEAAVSIPYEFLPLPEIGEELIALNREGKEIGGAVVIKKINIKKYDKTAVIIIRVSKNLCMEVRNIKLIKLNNEGLEDGHSWK